MRIPSFAAAAMLAVLLFQARPVLAGPPAGTNELVNYVIKVQMEDRKGGTNTLQVMTIDGTFDLQTLQKRTVKINNSEIPTTVSLKGTLTVLDGQKARLNFFLGRTEPVVTGSYVNGSAGGAASSYQQMQVGLSTTFVVTFGQPLTVQSDDSGQTTVLVTRDNN